MIWRLIFLFSLGSPVFAAPSWRAEALRMTGAGPGVGTEAVRRLRAMPGLDEDLRQALKTEDRFLAMDVIGNLRRESLRQELIDFSAGDASGFSYLALTAFVDKASAADYKKLFHSRLFARATSDAAKVILLDTLGRMNVPLENGEMRSLLLRREGPAVKSAALRFLRTRLLRRPADADLRLLGEVLRDRNLSSQRRIQALYLVSELSSKHVTAITARDLDCPKDLPEKIAPLCLRLKGGA